MERRTCKLCNAFFSGELNDTLIRLEKHRKKCDKESPFLNDEKADGYSKESDNL